MLEKHELIGAIKDLVARKMRADELSSAPRVEVISSFIETEIPRLQALPFDRSELAPHRQAQRVIPPIYLVTAKSVPTAVKWVIEQFAGRTLPTIAFPCSSSIMRPPCRKCPTTRTVFPANSRFKLLAANSICFRPSS